MLQRMESPEVPLEDVQKHIEEHAHKGGEKWMATHTTIYYCGANWHPGEAAGGYCGIQHNSQTERRTIFSIWDTSPTLHPNISYRPPA